MTEGRKKEDRKDRMKDKSRERIKTDEKEWSVLAFLGCFPFPRCRMSSVPEKKRGKKEI